MSVATTQNPTDQHGAKAHSDGGWDSPGYVPIQTRSARFTSTNPEEFPAVTGKEIQWKLTPVASIRSLIDGELDGSRYGADIQEADGAVIDWISTDEPSIGSAGAP